MFLMVGLVWFYGIFFFWLFNAKSSVYMYMIGNPVFKIQSSNSSISKNSIQRKESKSDDSNYCYMSLTV